MSAERLTPPGAGGSRPHRRAAGGQIGVLKAAVGPYNHANGTVRMGPRSDPQAVVGASGAVRAVAGLSVADASIMPTPPSTYPALTTMAIAEKIARDLRTQL